MQLGVQSIELHFFQFSYIPDFQLKSGSGGAEQNAL